MNRNNAGAADEVVVVRNCRMCYNIFLREDVYRQHIAQCVGNPIIDLARRQAEEARKSAVLKSAKKVVIAEADSTVPDDNGGGSR